MSENIYVKISKSQQKALSKMKRGQWYCSYDLGVSLATLQALKKKGVIEARYEPGYFYSPRTCILFKQI